MWGTSDVPPTWSQRLSSGPEDFHLRALPEPYVNLSIHTAPQRQQRADLIE